MGALDKKIRRKEQMTKHRKHSGDLRRQRVKKAELGLNPNSEFLNSRDHVPNLPCPV